MGGDLAPASPVKGALQFLHEFGPEYRPVLFGDRDLILREIENSKLANLKDGVEIVHTTQVVEMDESPAKAIREKKDSSMVKGITWHREGKVDAFISAGSTGAQMAASLLTLGRIKGVNRPVIASFLPAQHGAILLLDVGANTDCKPINLLQFGIMGEAYLKYIYDQPNPKIGLLSIGEEPTKGNILTKKAHELMTANINNFIGNIEGRDIMRNKAEIVVCDGFVGNVILKFAESVFGVITHGLKRHLGTNLFSNVGALLVKPAFKRLKMSYDYQEYGGVPLLGINGISIICHGASTPKAIKNAIRVAVMMKKKNLNEQIRENLNIPTLGDTANG